MAQVVLSGVTKRFRRAGAPAVDSLSLTVASGEILALLGPSGCGKTTTLRLIAGFEVPDAGRITIADRVVAEAGGGGTVSEPPEDRGVGIVFQDYALFPHLTVEQNVAFGLHAFAPAARRQRVRTIVDLTGLGQLGRRYPHELSGGQQQRTAVARALAPAPAVVLLDEPFSNLDADLRAYMRDEVERILRSTGTTAIVVTHDQEEAFTIADRVGVLDEGRLEQLDTPETVYHHPATPFVAAFVGAADFLPGMVAEHGILTELGLLETPVDGRAGERVKVMIRPDDVSFVPSERGAATIVRRYFRGSETLYALALPSGQRVYSSQPSSSDVPPGTRVQPEVHALHVVVFPMGGPDTAPQSPPRSERPGEAGGAPRPR